MTSATTRDQYVNAIRNSGVREALAVLQRGRDIGAHQQDRVWTAAWVLLDSCKRQARVMP